MVTGIGQMQSTAPKTMNGNIPTAAVEPVKRASDNRRSNKPIMEKRRRARINNCLSELKTLILDATKKDPARHSKLEKADILEKTVKYLQDLQRQQSAMSQAADPNIVNKFKAGFAECAKEVDRFHGIDPVVKRRLLQHLSNYLTGVKSEHQPQIQQVQIHMLPSSPPGSPEQDQQLLHPQQSQQQQQIFQISPANGYYLKINGVLTYVTPQQMQHVPQCAMPTLVPIPSRTSSTASAASIQSSETRQSPICYAPPSPANSYEAMDYQATPTTTPTPTSNHHPHHHLVSQQQQHMQRLAESQQRSYSPRPLSLVMKKEAQNEEDDERKRQATWRPW
ncbi:protein hairy [Bradysia coprophila]|uniref:protein hairy n=1 Tax=Bradysia coprophila TaxID=38358 RepID=UPI00187DB78C|nr:protein hairy [Bradysia coprophila]